MERWRGSVAQTAMPKHKQQKPKCCMLSLPPALLADQVRAASAVELARLEACASFLQKVDPQFSTCYGNVIEFAARRSVDEALRCVDVERCVGPSREGNHVFDLLPGESWKMLWHFTTAVVVQYDEDDVVFDEQAQAAFVLLLRGEAGFRPIAIRGLRRAALGGISSIRPLPRWAKVGAALGMAGQWTQAIELLHVGALFGARLIDLEGVGPARLLAQMSTLLTDKAYSTTSIGSGNNESRDIVFAQEFASCAVDLCRVAALEVLDDDGQDISDSDGEPRSEPGVPEALGRSLLALGRACALCVQHSGPHAIGPQWRRRVRPPPKVFAMGQEALAEAAALAEDAVDLAAQGIAQAALGELWFCAASASQFTNIFQSGSSAELRFESLACLPPPAPAASAVLHERILGNIRLTLASLLFTKRAINQMQDLGLGDAIEVAHMMKDIGKVHSYATRFPPHIEAIAVDGHVLSVEERNHGERAFAWLKRALELHNRLMGSGHKNTHNVRRLLGRCAPEDIDPEDVARILYEGTEAEDRDCKRDLDALTEQEASQYLDHQDRLGTLAWAAAAVRTPSTRSSDVQQPVNESRQVATASEGCRHSTTGGDNQRHPITYNYKRRQLGTANDNRQQTAINIEGQRRPATANTIQRGPATTANGQQQAMSTCTSQRQPATAGDARRRFSTPSGINQRRPATAQDNRRQSATISHSLRRPSTASDHCRQPATTASSQRQLVRGGEIQRRPTAASERERQTFVPNERQGQAKASDSLRRPASASDGLRRQAINDESRRYSAPNGDRPRKSVTTRRDRSQPSTTAENRRRPVTIGNPRQPQTASDDRRQARTSGGVQLPLWNPTW